MRFVKAGDKGTVKNIDVSIRSKWSWKGMVTRRLNAIWTGSVTANIRLNAIWTGSVTANIG